MATSSITANFTISDPKAARAFAEAFIRSSRKAATPVAMPWRVVSTAEELHAMERKPRSRRARVHA